MVLRIRPRMLLGARTCQKNTKTSSKHKHPKINSSESSFESQKMSARRASQALNRQQSYLMTSFLRHAWWALCFIRQVCQRGGEGVRWEYQGNVVVEVLAPLHNIQRRVPSIVDNRVLLRQAQLNNKVSRTIILSHLPEALHQTYESANEIPCRMVTPKVQIRSVKV